MRTCPKTEVPATVRDRTEKRRNGILLHHGVCRPEGIELAIRPPFPQGSLRSPCGKGGMTESAWMQDTSGLACIMHRSESAHASQVGGRPADPSLCFSPRSLDLS